MGNLQSAPWWIPIVFGIVALAFAAFLRKQDPGWFERLASKDSSARCFGCCSLLFGGFITYVLVLLPIVQASAHRQSVSVVRGAFVVPGFFFFIGLVTLVAGSRSKQFVLTRHGQSPTALQKWTAAIGVMICILAEIVFHCCLSTLGYSSRW